MSVLTVAEENLHGLLSIDHASLSRLFKSGGRTTDYLSQSMAATLTQDTLEATFGKCKEVDEPDSDDLRFIINQVEKSWVRADFYPEISRDEFLGNEQLCSLLAKIAFIGLEGLRSGLWKRLDEEHIAELQSKIDRGEASG